MEVTYWRESNQEVDFVLRHRDRVVGIEVKSGRSKGALAGLQTFTNTFNARPGLLVGTGGVPLEQFLTMSVGRWLE